MEKNKISWIDYIYLLVKWRKLVVINFFAICAITAIFSLIMPKTFEATTVILPPTSDEMGVASLLSGLPKAALGLGGMNPEAITFMAILNSRTIMQSVAKKFDLQQRYQLESMEDTIETLRENAHIELREDEFISVRMGIQTPYFSNQEKDDDARQLAAAIANFFIEELDRVNKELQTTQARYNREFIEERYHENLADLADVEQQLKEFQQKHNAIALPEQVKAAITSAAEIKAQILAAEVELAALRTSLNENHPQIKQTKTKINELNNILHSLKYGGSLKNEEEMPLFPAFAEAPELGVRYIQLTREMETQNTLYKFLIQQYEQAKVQEAKDTPTVQVLDPAIPPFKRSKPRRTLMVLLAGAVSILASLLLIAAIEFFRALQTQQTDEKQQFIVETLKDDLDRVTLRKRHPKSMES